MSSFMSSFVIDVIFLVTKNNSNSGNRELGLKKDIKLNKKRKSSCSDTSQKTLSPLPVSPHTAEKITLKFTGITYLLVKS